MTKRTLVVLLAFFAFISLGLPDGLLGVSWPSISRTFAQPLDALGLIVAVTVSGYLLSSFACGAILRFLPLGMVLALSTAAAAASLVMFALAPVWPVVVAFAFVAGLGGGAVDAGLNAYGAAHFSARTLNWLHAFFGLGTTLGPLIVTTVLGAGLEWRWSYALVGAAQAVLAVTFFLSRDLWRPAAEDAREPSVPPAASLDTLRRPVVWLGMAVFFLYSGVEIATAQWSFSVLTLGRGMDQTTAGLSVTGYWGSLMAGRVLFGFIADRVPLVPILRAALSLSVLGALLFWLGSPWWLSLAGLMLMGLAFAPIFASLIGMTPRRVGRAHADSAIGFQVAAAGLGAAVVTALIGILADGMGLEIVGASLLALTVLLVLVYEALVRR